MDLKSMDLKTLKTEFLEYLEIEKGRSLKTVANYDRYIKHFLDIARIEHPRDITDDVIRKYRLRLNRQSDGKSGTLKKRTQNYYLIALRSFLAYLARRNVESLTPERIELAKTGQRELDIISSEELERLLQAPDGESLKSLRDRAILELLFSTGMRVSELCSVNRDLDLKKEEFSIRGKGEKVRVVFLSSSAKDALIAYLDERTDMDEALFVQVASASGAQEDGGRSLRLSSRSVERIVKHYAVKAGISKKVTPHVIRHSFATDLLINGADLRSVQALLGHAHIATTQVYTHVTDRHLHDVHKAFHSKGRK